MSLTFRVERTASVLEPLIKIPPLFFKSNSSIVQNDVLALRFQGIACLSQTIQKVNMQDEKALRLQKYISLKI